MPGPVPNLRNVATALEMLTTETKAYVENPPDNLTIIESIRNLSRDMHRRFSEMDTRFSEMDARFSEMDVRFDDLSMRLTAVEQQHFES